MCAVRAAVSGCARANLSTGERFPALAGRAGVRTYRDNIKGIRDRISC